MGNHWHGLIETPEANLSIGMKWLQSTYTQRFNRHHKECGHLFQWRYKGLPIDPDAEEYFHVVSNYIHLNPARAKQITLPDGKLANYPWSRYPFYIRTRKRPDWLYVDRVLSSCRLNVDRQGRLQYRQRMQLHVDELSISKTPGEYDPDWSMIRRGWCLGSRTFRERLLDKLDTIRSATQPASLHGDEIRLHDERQATKLKEQGLKILGLTKKGLACLTKGANEKKALAWFIKSQTVVTNAWLAKQL
jgi:putative transposase